MQKTFCIAKPGDSLQLNNGLLVPYIMLYEASEAKVLEKAKTYLKNSKGIKAVELTKTDRFQFATTILREGELSNNELIEKAIKKLIDLEQPDKTDEIIKIIQQVSH